MPSPIVTQALDATGGVHQLARRCYVSTRTLYAWLQGTRSPSPACVALMRQVMDEEESTVGVSDYNATACDTPDRCTRHNGAKCRARPCGWTEPF